MIFTRKIKVNLHFHNHSYYSYYVDSNIDFLNHGQN